jgi:hypothetical protein
VEPVPREDFRSRSPKRARFTLGVPSTSPRASSSRAVRIASPGHSDASTAPSAFPPLSPAVAPSASPPSLAVEGPPPPTSSSVPKLPTSLDAPVPSGVADTSNDVLTRDDADELACAIRTTFNTMELAMREAGMRMSEGLVEGMNHSRARRVQIKKALEEIDTALCARCGVPEAEWQDMYKSSEDSGSDEDFDTRSYYDRDSHPRHHDSGAQSEPATPLDGDTPAARVAMVVRDGRSMFLRAIRDVCDNHAGSVNTWLRNELKTHTSVYSAISTTADRMKRYSK